MKNKFRKVFPNPTNIQNYLGSKIKTKILRVTLTSNEITIETEEALTEVEKTALEEFLKFGLNSIWKFVKSEVTKDAR